MTIQPPKQEKVDPTTINHPKPKQSAVISWALLTKSQQIKQQTNKPPVTTKETNQPKNKETKQKVGQIKVDPIGTDQVTLDTPTRSILETITNGTVCPDKKEKPAHPPNITTKNAVKEYKQVYGPSS